jgi:asparagine synthase (glutamine-hydrolysing)
MCGINGIVGMEGVNASEPILRAMNSALAHRGPDADGVFIDAEAGVAFGHRRLAIIDLSQNGNQPFTSSDRKLTLVFNGEIYNYPELRKQLADYPFQSGGDTEVILAAYSRWGVDCVHHFNGMFAFALYDAQKQRVLIARDRLGIKPLYYAQHGSGLVFSSELRAILASGLVDRKINRKGLIDFLRYQTVHAPETIIDGVFMLEPGHRIVVSDSEIVHEAWWDLASAVKPVLHSREHILTEIREKLTQSVELRMRADVNFGAFLSGGIDSSAIVGLMSEVSDRPVQTFTVTFDESDFNEGVYAAQIAKKFNTDHTAIRLSPGDFLDAIPAALAAMDHPSGDGPNTFIVSQATRNAGVKMALSGLGGDELFAGYSIFKQATDILDKRWLMSYPKVFRRMAGWGLRTMKPGIASWKTSEILIQDYLDLEHIYPYSRLVLSDQQVSSLRSDGRIAENRVKSILQTRLAPNSAAFALPYLSQVSIAEISTYMQNVLLRDTDQMSMAHALEVRVPFLDHNLVTYTLGVPDPYKFPHTPKKLLTDALGTLIPQEIVERKKMGFTLPWEHWMKHELKDFCSGALTQLGKREGFNPRGIQQLWQSFISGSKTVTWSRVWHLVVLENWLKQNNVE